MQSTAEITDQLKAKEAALITRLDRGLAKIAAARAQGEPVERWTDLWIDLLGEYERVWDKRTAMEGGA